MSLFSPLVYHWCRKQGATPEAAKRVGQDIFLHVYQKLPAFQSEDPSETFHSWLARITHNKILDDAQQHRSLNHDQKFTTGSANSVGEEPVHQTDVPENEYALANSIHNHDTDAIRDETNQLYQSTLTFFKESLSEWEWILFSRLELQHHSLEDVANDFQRSSVEIVSIKSRLLRKFRQEFAGLFQFE